jgi:putative restriction endonuclease
MPLRTNWTRDQQLAALRLYMRSSFGKLHGRNPEIISLARHSELNAMLPSALKDRY